MKIMTAETFVPFGKKPALSAASLARWLEAEGAAAEAVSLPLSPGKEGELSQLFSRRLFHLEHACGLLIPLDLTAVLLPHPHKVVWMTGPFPLLGDEILDQYRLRAVTRGLGEAEKIFAAGEELAAWLAQSCHVRAELLPLPRDDRAGREAARRLMG